MSLTVDHIGNLVKRTAKAEDVFKCLGYKIKRELYHDESRKCDFSFLEKDGLVIELITPWNSESPIFPMLKHHKNMIYHISYKSDNMDEDIKTLEEKLSGAAKESAEWNKIDAELSAAQKAYNYQREGIQKEFEHKITSLQGALDTANIAVTDNGTRSKRLDLVNSRLMTQTTTFQSLQSENEDIDLATTVTQLTSAQVTYEASLMATGKISQTSLMNYI